MNTCSIATKLCLNKMVKNYKENTGKMHPECYDPFLTFKKKKKKKKTAFVVLEADNLPIIGG